MQRHPSFPAALSLVPVAAALLASAVRADVVTLQASKDNTLYQSTTGALSNGAGEHFFAGCTDDGLIRRGLIAFDVNAAIPPGSTINSVTLTLYMSRSKTTAKVVGLRLAGAAWGEGASVAAGEEGAGASAAPGDATWLHTFYPGLYWAAAGGDFAGAASASLSVDKEGFYTWTGAGLLSDVQAWVDNPGTAFGWVLVGDESQAKTSKRFDTRQLADVSKRPKLVVNFTPGVPTGACCFPAGGCAGLTAAECAAQGGTYLGDGMTCFPSPCTVPTGACCFDDTGCTTLSAANCAAQGGTYQGDGSTCAASACPLVLDPYVDALPIPAVAMPVVGVPGGAAQYEIRMVQQLQKLHASLPPTTVWAYAGGYPGPVIEASRDQPVQVKWINDLRDSAGNLLTSHYLPVDTCMHGPDTEGDAPRTVVHLHGGHVPPASDGYPEATLLPGESVTYQYPNHQLPATIWFHDHALGITRLNVYMGLAGLYLIRDPVELSLGLPAGQFEVPLVIQDRSFNPDGTLQYPAQWEDHFFGDKILVNGKVWPFHGVKRGKYRFRLLNGCNSRTLTLALSNGATFHQIGTDGGLLAAPVPLTKLTFSPGERADVVMDFAAYSPGQVIDLVNSAPAPFPGPAGVGVVPQVMRFVVQGGSAFTAPLPAVLRPPEVLSEASAEVHREFVLAKSSDPCAGTRWLIDGLGWHDVTEYPKLGSTEVWSFINDSGVVHPMHMHLVFFQVLDRQPFEKVGGQIVPTGLPVPPAPNEAGWKDTVQTLPKEITRVIARFEDYTGRYPYHCHILEHEDHEMMRQFQVILGPDVVTYGCGLNPAGSLVHLGGEASLGSVVTLGVDNPVGTQAPGSLPFLGLAFAANPAGPPCGTPLPGYGMAGGGSPGELLISLAAPNPFQVLAGAPWAGPGSPSVFALPIPSSATLIGLSVFAQGILLDFTPGAHVPVGLAGAAELRIGP